jgi:PAS domain-containing protein
MSSDLSDSSTRKAVGGRTVRLHPKLYQRFNRSRDSVMIRDLEGNIRFWNVSAEKYYRRPRSEVIGKVSHEILETVFPCPLEEINAELVRKGYWEGELIHTIGGGLRVKVRSRWELESSPTGPDPSVVETNRVEKIIGPEDSHLSGSPLRRLFIKLYPALLWPCIATLVLMLVAIFAVSMVEHSNRPAPLLDPSVQ